MNAVEATPVRSATLNRRKPQLDALRALAIIAVLLSHFSPTIGRLPLELGPLGVRLFFVLSGFLITGILLSGRRAWHDRGGGGGAMEAKRFYGRRALRILPPFYALLLLSAAFAIEPFRATFWWHAWYASNILIAHEGGWIGPASHLWSLAVEEQFYLIWPWLVWTIPERWLGGFFAAACMMGPLVRAIILAFRPNDISALVLTPCCLDSLGAGAFVAWAWAAWAGGEALRWPWRPLGFALLILGLGWSLFVTNPWLRTVPLPFVQALGFAAIVSACAEGVGGRTGRLLSWRPLLWLGQISYGLYLVHNHANWIGPRLLRYFTPDGAAYFKTEIWQVVYYIGLSLAAATASWYFLELPVLRWKNRIAWARYPSHG